MGGDKGPGNFGERGVDFANAVVPGDRGTQTRLAKAGRQGQILRPGRSCAAREASGSRRPDRRLAAFRALACRGGSPAVPRSSYLPSMEALVQPTRGQ